MVLRRFCSESLSVLGWAVIELVLNTYPFLPEFLKNWVGGLANGKGEEGRRGGWAVRGSAVIGLVLKTWVGGGRAGRARWAEGS